MQDVLGWVSSFVLLLTLLKQVHKQWTEDSSAGVSKTLYIGQLAASSGFFLYSWLLRNWVFAVTNLLLLCSSVAGLLILLHQRRQQARRQAAGTADAQQPSEKALDLDKNEVWPLAELHAKTEQETTLHQRIIEALTARLGQPRTLYFLCAAILLWIGYNFLPGRLSVLRFDPPPFAWLQGAIGFMALLMTAMILITQQRQSRVAAQRALLDLHVNLLSEQKAAKLIALLEELRCDLPSVCNRRDQQAEQMSQPVDPQEAIDKLEEQIAQTLAKPAQKSTA